MKRNIALATARASTTAEPAADSHSAIIDEREALKRVPVSRRTWFDWRQKKGLPHIRVGKRVLYDWDNVRQWLLRQQRGGR